MKSLILVRHGAYDDRTKELFGSGREAIGSLGKVIAARIKGNFDISSSGVKRADQSAQILQKVLGVKKSVKSIPSLDYQSKYLEEGRAFMIYDHIRASEKIVDNLILVTHEGVVNGFPNFFMGEREWKMKFNEKVHPAYGVYLDLENKTVQLLTPYMD